MKWTLEQFKSGKLPAMIEKAGYPGVAVDLDSDLIASVLPKVDARAWEMVERSAPENLLIGRSNMTKRIVGAGEFTYEVIYPFGQMLTISPEGRITHVAVDSKDRVYAFLRAEVADPGLRSRWQSADHMG